MSVLLPELVGAANGKRLNVFGPGSGLLADFSDEATADSPEFDDAASVALPFDVAVSAVSPLDATASAASPDIPAVRRGRNIALLMAYDGTRYAGWQRQAEVATVQGCIEKALRKICGHELTLYGCSRTDAGVHAQGHVSNFFTDCRIPAERLPLALDGLLPPDIVCRAAVEAPPDFNARFKAGGKQYSYYIQNGGRPLPDWRRRSYFEARPLDVAAMREAASYLVGEHDFAAFQASGSPATGGTLRRLYSVAVCELRADAYQVLFRAEEGVAAALPGAYGSSGCALDAAGGPKPAVAAKRAQRWAPLRRATDAELSLPAGLENTDCGRPHLLRIVVHGSGFLYNMMRILSGSLLYVGLGKLTPDQLRSALAGGDRRLAGKTLGAQGLCLDWVDYPFPLF